MQSLDVISFNLWQALISLCNLLILFFILKRFLYKPVRRVIAERDSAVKKMYSDAEAAESIAEKNRLSWEDKLQAAESEREEILSRASRRANDIGEQIISKAKNDADIIVKNAKNDAAQEYQKAQDEIKKEIIAVSTMLTEKLLCREINTNDHYALIDKVISKMGDENDGNL